MSEHKYKVLRFLPGSDAFVAVQATTHQLHTCTLRNLCRAPQPVQPLSTLARRTDGHVFGLNPSGTTLYHVDLTTGSTSRIGRLFLGHHTGGFSGSIDNVRGLAFSDQPHELWGILPCQTLAHQNVDAMIRINTRTGEVDAVQSDDRC